jgi:hypothetical protein
MAIKVNSLTTKNISVVSDASNEYLYITNALSRTDSKIPLNNLITTFESVGTGKSLVSTATSLNRHVIKSLEQDASGIITVGAGSSVITVGIDQTQIDLSKCKNTTTPFLSTINLTTNVGATVLPTANGGTNKSSAYVVGDIVYASATDTLAGLADIATGNALISGGIGVAPSWGKIALGTHVSGTLSVGNGGTGATSHTSKGVLLGNNTGAVTTTNAGGTNGTVLIGNASGSPQFGAITSPDSTITFTTGAGALGLSTKITTLENASGTAGLVCDSSGNLISQADATLAYKRPIVNVASGTYNPTAAQSGSIFTLNLAGGITVTLPAAAAGLTYEFHIGTTFSGTLTINAASSADTLQGAIYMGTGLVKNDSADNTDNHGYASPAAADHQYVADADTKGRLLGTRLKYTAITDAIWLVEGFAITDGAIATPWT